MARPTFKSFKTEAFKKKGVKEEYAELAPAYEVRKKLIALRQKAGYTQEQIRALIQISLLSSQFFCIFHQVVGNM